MENKLKQYVYFYIYENQDKIYYIDLCRINLNILYIYSINKKLLYVNLYIDLYMLYVNMYTIWICYIYICAKK